MTLAQGIKPRLTEEELARRSQCAWKPAVPAEDVFEPGLETFRWGLLERLEGSIPTNKELRERYMFQFHKVWGDQPRAGKVYWAGINYGVSLASRLRQFLLKYTCMQPLQPYELELPSGIITGQAAIVTRTTTRVPQRTLAIDILARQPKYYLTMPGYVSLARWLAMRNLYDGVNLGLVHQPLIWGNLWTETSVNEPLAKQTLDSILKQITDPVSHPTPGSQCRGCAAPCKVIFNGSNGSSWD